MKYWLLTGLLFCTVPLSAHADDVIEAVIKETAHQVFSDAERHIIHEYYGETHGGPGKVKGKGKGPGKNGRLPPGLQKQLERNGELPPGIQKKALPTGLIDRLPPAPKGYERVIVDADVLLVHAASRIIADIIHDVVLDN